MEQVVSSATTTLPVSRRSGISEQARYHNELRRRVLDVHPDAANLNGPDWRTAFAPVALIAIYWATAWGVSKTSWWFVFIVALCFGQFVYHSAASLVHESAHRLVFRNSRAKLGFDIALETVLTSFGAQLVYQHNHVTSHHAHLGEYEGDYEHEDIYRVAARKAYREQHPVLWRFVSVGILIFHLLPFAIITDTLVLPKLLGRAEGLPSVDKLRDVGATKPSRGELRLFAIISLAVNVVAYLTLGFLGWLFHAWSMSLILSRWGASIRGQILSEHYGEDTEYPTRSTYWWGNWVFFNIGYHVEHHTFPNVPWTRLRQLRATAPEHFNIANKLNYFGFWWKQVKADFTLPRRRSALDPEAILKKREAMRVPEASPIAA